MTSKGVVGGWIWSRSEETTSAIVVLDQKFDQICWRVDGITVQKQRSLRNNFVSDFLGASSRQVTELAKQENGQSPVGT